MITAFMNRNVIIEMKGGQDSNWTEFIGTLIYVFESNQFFLKDYSMMECTRKDGGIIKSEDERGSLVLLNRQDIRSIRTKDKVDFNAR